MEFIRRYISKARGALALLSLSDQTKLSPGKVLELQSSKTPDSILIRFEDKTITYRTFNEASNRYAHFFIDSGFKKGETVALFMENRPEYLMIHSGLSKAGIVPALVNTNIRGQALVHAIRTADSRAIIVGEELTTAFQEAYNASDDRFCGQIYSDREDPDSEIPPGMTDLTTAVATRPTTDPKITATAGDTLEYIYTSGTTGFPKATVLKNKKWLQLGYAVGGLTIGTVPGAVQYLCLPLYHNSGINIAWPLTLMWGGTLAMTRKFSATAFWEDIRKHDASLFIYIGELCRYLNNQPEKENDGDNPLRFILGNGMREDYWRAFQKRFRIERIFEVYGSTEGVGGLINKKGIPGMIGRLSIAGFVKMGEVARCDRETGELIRKPNGFAEKCRPGETGMFLPKISRFNQFAGYKNNTKATGKKIVSNVFKKGDRYFVSGDLFRLHKKGYVSFVDRLGDTFKWKGEVVATSEVTDILSRFGGIEDANVYGVTIRGTEGRAGMAALTLAAPDAFDFDCFADFISKNIAVYAVPRMLRIRQQADITSTFKQLKTELKKEGFNPETISDPLFFLHPETQKYVKLTSEIYSEIQNGKIRF